MNTLNSVEPRLSRLCVLTETVFGVCTKAYQRDGSPGFVGSKNKENRPPGSLLKWGGRTCGNI